MIYIYIYINIIYICIYHILIIVPPKLGARVSCSPAVPEKGTKEMANRHKVASVRRTQPPGDVCWFVKPHYWDLPGV